MSFVGNRANEFNFLVNLKLLFKWRHYSLKSLTLALQKAVLVIKIEKNFGQCTAFMVSSRVFLFYNYDVIDSS